MDNFKTQKSEKQRVSALVVRYRLYLANEVEGIYTENDRYAFASEVLNISPVRARNLLIEHKDIRHLAKEECYKMLAKLNRVMLCVAQSDITLHKYEKLLSKKENDLY